MVYRVVFALPELDPTFRDSEILLADRRDGKPLEGQDGRLRLIIPHEKVRALGPADCRDVDLSRLAAAKYASFHELGINLLRGHRRGLPFAGCARPELQTLRGCPSELKTTFVLDFKGE